MNRTIDISEIIDKAKFCYTQKKYHVSNVSYRDVHTLDIEHLQKRKMLTLISEKLIRRGKEIYTDLKNNNFNENDPPPELPMFLYAFFRGELLNSEEIVLRNIGVHNENKLLYVCGSPRSEIIRLDDIYYQLLMITIGEKFAERQHVRMHA